MCFEIADGRTGEQMLSQSEGDQQGTCFGTPDINLETPLDYVNR